MSLCTYSQNYETVNDTLVLNLMRTHIDFSNSTKKIADKSILWKEAQLSVFSWTGYKNFDKQLADIIDADKNIYSDQKEKFTQMFDKEDLNYMKNQFDNEPYYIWNFKSKTGKIKKNPKSNFYKLSNPIFNKTKLRAIIYQELYCGPLCGGGIIFIYVKEYNSWRLYKEIPLWVS